MARHVPTALGMLKDIPSESAQQLLNAIRYQIDPPGSTMLPELDEHIFVARDNPFADSSLNRGDVIEIQGPAASGKTQLLYHLTACCILPKEVPVESADAHAERTVHLGGWSSSTVVLDCDGRWDTMRLYNILVTRLDLALSKYHFLTTVHQSHPSVPSIALDALSRLHVFHPASSFQLAATLLNLPKYHAEKMPKEEIRLLLVDSISAFHWADRWQAEPSGSKKLQKPNPLGQVLRALQAFRLSHGPVTVLTNWALSPLPSSTSSDSPGPFFRQHLAAPYPAPFDESSRRSISGQSTSLTLNCHITLPFTFISPLQLDLGHSLTSGSHEGGRLEEALRDLRRKEVVHRGEIGAYVRIPRTGHGQDLAPRSVGRFRLRVLERNIVSPS
ncbi:hypothetical protein K439DRAFT_1626404 [Ramaria rubella]|nr:hypothetical protein K439DRAFT_1626404 [Ramaria rubella]